MKRGKRNVEAAMLDADPPGSAQPPLEVRVAEFVLGWLAAAALLAIVIVRCVIVFSPQLHWMVDPRLAPDAGRVEFGPTGAAITNWLAVLVLGLAVVQRLFAGGRVAWWALGLWGFGAAVALHQGGQDFDSLRIGGDWIAITAVAIAAMHLGADRTLRRVLLAGVIALALPLAIQAFLQVTIEHQMTVADYMEHREEQTRARGWEPGSPEQRKFEERLKQLEATGRVGFSNIFGSMMATLTLAASGAAAALWRRGNPRKAALPGAIALIAAAVLLVTFSKGAALALLIGGGAVGSFALIAHRWPAAAKMWGAVGVIILLMGIGAVAIRGSMGEPESAAGERSLLFRWHYWQAAARMIEREPMVGIGPGRFKDHYMRLKNPLNPEDVADPHNLFVAYIATLGIGGLAWSMMLLVMLGRAGRRVGSPGDLRAAPASPQFTWSVILAAAAIAFGTQYVVEQDRYWIVAAIGWLLGAAGFAYAAGWLAMREELDHYAARVGLFAAATAMLLHAQIEMSMTNTMAGPLLACVLGLAAARPGVERVTRRRTITLVTLLFAAALSLLMVRQVLPIKRHQAAMAGAAKSLQRGDHREAIYYLRAARAAQPNDPRAWAHEARLLVELAQQNHHAGQTAQRDQNLGFAVVALEKGEMANPGRPAILHAQLGLYAEAWQLTRLRGYRDSALNTAGKILVIEPLSDAAHLEAAEIAWELRDFEKARTWYRRAIELDRQAYLDPTGQMSPAELQRVRQRLQ